MNYEKKVNSKLHIFFDWLYKLLIMNVLTFFFSILIVTFLPAITAMNATIKYDMNDTRIFRCYFSNFKRYFWKSFKIELLFLVVGLIVFYAFYFYSYGIFNQEDTPYYNVFKIIFQVGVAVILLLGIIIVLMCLHLPLLIITFESLTVMETIKTAFYIVFRYFLTTLILLAMFILKIIGTIAAPIWLLVGISLPTLLGIKLTYPVYYKFENIDLEKIMHQVEEDLDE